MKSGFEEFGKNAVPSIPRWKVWICLWGGGILWVVQLLLLWVAAEFGCEGSWAKQGLGGVTGVAWLVVVASVILMAKVVWIIRLSEQIERGGGDRETMTFVARVGKTGNGLFLLVMMAQMVPVWFFLRDCGGNAG